MNKISSQPLDNNGWSKLYNLDILNSVVNSINTGNVSVWSKELVQICKTGSKTLEIGCGTGTSSLWLAKNGITATAIDYAETAVELVKAAANRLGFDNLDVIHCDATGELPFNPKEFDFIFQAGLLEHFETDEQVKLLRNWTQYGKKMISMIPNAASIPYRVGKQMMEKEGSWEYGLETKTSHFEIPSEP